MKLNIGCGEDIREGFINADAREFPEGLKLDAKDPLPYEDDFFDLIVAQKLLDYIPRNRLLPLLKEFHRTLKIDGILEIRVTDISLITKALYLNNISNEMGLNHEMILALLYGKQAHDFDIKYNGFTSEFLQGLLTALNFHICTVKTEDFDVIITSKKLPLDPIIAKERTTKDLQEKNALIDAISLEEVIPEKLNGKIVQDDGTVLHFKDGNLHRDGDEPAVIQFDGTRKWYKEGLLDRKNAPAIIDLDGKEFFYENGEEIKKE